MKKSYINVLWAMAFPLFMGSCSEEDYSDADMAGIATVEDYANAISVSVDQNTNVVTFEVTDKMAGAFPIWEFGPGYSDDKSTSTVSKVTKTYKKRGTYTVSFRVANKNGVSDGVVTKNFTIERTLVEESQIKALTGNVLYWNFVANGHFGCGSANNAGADNYGLDWWSCSANGKKDSGMYDDTFTFSTDMTSGTVITGTYAYDPGADGLVHCNSGVTFDPFGASNPNNGDFDAPAEKQTSTWKLYYDQNDVLWLEFGAKTNVGYIPNEETWNAPKFRIITLTDKKLAMVTDNGGISWRYVFCPEAQNAVDDCGMENYREAIVGSWTWNSSVAGHFGCGESVDNPLNWWSCGAEGKAGYSMYDDIMSFTADGQYTYDPVDGKTYMNKGCTFDPAQTNDADDYVADVTKQTTTYEIVEEGGNLYLVLPAKTLFSYLSDDSMYNSPKFLIKRVSKDKNTIEFASVQSGISWMYQLKRVE